MECDWVTDKGREIIEIDKVENLAKNGLGNLNRLKKIKSFKKGFSFS